MTTVKISPKYQVVIPAELRREMGLKPGQRLQVVRLGERIEMIPVRKMSKSRGFLKGLDTTVKREEDRL